MSLPVTSKIIKPEQCVFGFGIPTTQADFFNDQLNPNKAFAKQFDNVWLKYEHQIISHINAVTPKFEQYGVTVLPNLTLHKFGELFSDEHFEVIILFSHWENDAVEFYDGLAEVPMILEQIPNDFSGILDLSICQPIPLAEAIIKNRQKCVVKITCKRATPFLWLYTYEALFWLLRNKNLKYLEANEQVIEQMLIKSEK